MWKQSVWTSVIASGLGAHHLKEGGVLVLTGAQPALKETPGKTTECDVWHYLSCQKHI